MGLNSLEYLGVITSGEIYTDTVVSTGSCATTIQPDKGQVYHLVGLYCSVPTPGGTANGTHLFKIKQKYITTLDDITILEAIATHNQSLTIKGGCIIDADSSKFPTNYDEQILQMQNMRATNTYPIRIQYLNNTDQDQANDIKMLAALEVYQEVLE